MAITPIPIVTFQSSIQPVNPPAPANPASQNNGANQNQVQDLQQLPVNQIPTQAPGLFGLAFALENLDQRDQNFLTANLPKAPLNPARSQQPEQTQNSNTSNTQNAPNSSPTPGAPQPKQPVPGQFPPPNQVVSQLQASATNATPQQEAGAVLNLFA